VDGFRRQKLAARCFFRNNARETNVKQFKRAKKKTTIDFHIVNEKNGGAKTRLTWAEEHFRERVQTNGLGNGAQDSSVVEPP